MKKTTLFLSLFALFFSSNALLAQINSGEIDGSTVNTITTAVPFLRIIPDARSAGMGDVGIAISPDANSIFYNGSKMAFAEDKLGLSVTYTPWLRQLVDDVYMANLSGYAKIDDNQAVGLSLRYFSLGNISFTDITGASQGEFRPNEFALDAGYARKLGENLSVGTTLRFIYSNLASGQNVAGEEIKAGTAAAADISMFYSKDLEISDIKSNLAVGLAISNIGTKISYSDNSAPDSYADFIPTNLGLGTALTMNFDDYNKLTIAGDINKLLVPTPDSTGTNEWKNQSGINGIFSSFSDAPGGGSEELNELMYSIGLEYWYNNLFAVRTGYYNEHKTKGNRKYLTLGVGVKYSVFGLNFSYLVPASNRNNPLGNTLRFSLLFDFEAFGKNNDSTPDSDF